MADVAKMISQLVDIVEHKHATPKLRAEAITHAYELGIIEGKLLGAIEFDDRLKRTISKPAQTPA